MILSRNQGLSMSRKLFSIFQVLVLSLCSAISISAQTFTDASHLLDVQDGTLHAAWGASIADMDGNGLADIYEPGILYLQQEDGSFVSSLPDLGIDFRVLNTQGNPIPLWGRGIFGAVMADVDDDGFSEMVVMDLTSDSSHFYQGRYGLRLEEVGPAVGIIFRGLGQGSTFADFNGDGPIDLFFGEEQGHNQLFQGDGSGSFLETTLLAGVDSSVQTYGVAAADYDNDGDLDIFIGACAILDPSKSVNLLFRNNGDGTFEEVGEEAGINDNFAAWGVSWLDYDQDGFYDVYVANMFIQDGRSGRNMLYHNLGDGTFEEVARQAGVAGDSTSFSFGSSAADFNNDGLIDIYSANTIIGPPSLYINNGDGTFTDIYTLSGVTDVFTNYSVAVADLNNDGWLDFFTGSDPLPPAPGSRIFLNEGGTNGFLKVELIQPAPNKRAIGARIELWHSGVLQMRDITSGDGFSSQNMAHSAHFGVGTTQLSDSLVVIWPDGSRDVWNDINRDSHLWLEKGGAVNRPPTTFRAHTILTKQIGKRVFGSTSWDVSTDPEGVEISYQVVVRDPSGSIVHESEPIKETEYMFSVDSLVTGTGDYRYVVIATDGLHVRRSVNTGGALMEGTATESVELPSQMSISALYPQPASEHVRLEYETSASANARWEIVNMLGQVVLSGEEAATSPGNQSVVLDLSVLAAGVYGLTLRTDYDAVKSTLVIAR